MRPVGENAGIERDEESIRKAERHEAAALRHRLMARVWFERGDRAKAELEFAEANREVTLAAELRERATRPREDARP
jgi:hypothetical protein